MEGFTEKDLYFLSPAKRQAVVRIMKEIENPEIQGGSLYLGKRFSELHDILVPYGYWLKALDAIFSISAVKTQRTVYSYMYGYRQAASTLPHGAIDAMIARRLVVSTQRREPGNLGEWTETIAAVPAPATGSASSYLRWVDEMIAKKPKRATGNLANLVPRDPDEVLLECYRAIERMGKRLPAKTAVREHAVRRLISYTMKYFGLKPDKFVPADIPPEFHPVRRRYREVGS